MANEDAIAGRGGLLPVQFPFGNYKKTLYRLTTDATAAIYIGAPMDLDANGRVVRATTGADNTMVLGPALGFADTNKAGLPSGMCDLNKGPYLPANTDAYVVVCDDPNQLFAIQCDTSASFALVDVGANARFTLRTSAGSDLTGHSTAELLTSDIAGDTGGCLRVVALADNINNDGTNNGAAENYSKVVVRIHHHRYGPGEQTNGI